MKKIIAIIVVAMALVTASYAEDTASAAPVENKPAEVQATPIPAKDRALAFIISKAETYSEKAEVAVTKAVDFVCEQTPLVIQEFLMWRFAKAAITVGFLFLTLVGIWAGYLFFYKKCGNITLSDDRGLARFGLTALLLISMIPICTFGSRNLLTAVQIKMAPRVYLIEQAMDLYKK